MFLAAWAMIILQLPVNYRQSFIMSEVTVS
jgi:hypothetical protein